MERQIARPPFTTFEKEFLRELVSPYMKTIECKKTNAVYNRQKDIVWEQITKKFNSSELCTKTSQKQLKKAWYNMKSRAKGLGISLNDKHTVDDHSDKEMVPETETVLPIMPNVLYDASVLNDCNAPAGVESDDDECTLWRLKNGHSRSSPTPQHFDVSINPEHSSSPALHQATTSHRRHSAKNSTTVEELRIQIVKNEKNHRVIKNNLELEHIKKLNKYKEELLQIQLMHKRRLLEMAEEAHDLKIKKLREDD